LAVYDRGVGLNPSAIDPSAFCPLPSAFVQLRDYGKILRLTAYGEIVAVPQEAISPLIRAAKTTLGYTHQWRSDLALPYRGYLMASVENQSSAIMAREMGWKTYRIYNSGADLREEVQCTNQASSKTARTAKVSEETSDTASSPIQCQDCRLCDGKTANVAATVHGLPFKVNRAKKAVQ
jgi:hypothetical protein